jgi:hypothetical protein
MINILIVSKKGVLNCNAGCAKPGDKVENPALQNADIE